MNEKTCFACVRKTECYSELGLKDLKPNQTYRDTTGYECGVAFTNYEELREFVFVIGEAIGAQSKKVQNGIFQYIANKCDLPVYTIMLELERG